ncbi:CoA pyrophosphatase [Acuticoccus sp. MNP-M23]|uniref:NUDIX hydrolase n=1 Tax=Acuticoccus sp. MNP-M23 TaxID=3072793 RepID=UPI0028156154|nr:CoA pyrophosphatase [Acuticoccus sp. MNP-M23]WMS42752.1 CoA pyrophosphatase [Acuticoccus sp. MNP-M23]
MTRADTAPDGPVAIGVAAADRSDPVIAEIAARAARLLPPGTAPDTAAARFGDHVLNPSFAGSGTRPPRAAAVLMALGRDAADGTPVMLLTERATHLAAHPGQVALPGGKIEAGETPAETALREAHEEIDLLPAAVEVLGVGDAYHTRTGFVVVPVLGLLARPATLTPAPGEVASVFTAPYQQVMTLANHREVRVTRDGLERTYFEVMSGQKRIWGVTAGILRLMHGKLYGP